MNKRFLVVAHAGDAPLPAWWRAAADQRDWDLAVVSSTDPRRHAALGDSAIVLHRPGPRWPAVAALLDETLSAWTAYEHVWIADGALESSVEDVNRLFAIVGSLALPLAQPSFSADSAGVQALSVHNDAFSLRYANTVEPAAAMFSAALLQRALPLLAASDDDSLLGQRLPGLLDDAARGCVIVDRVVVRRPGRASPDSGLSGLSTAGYDQDGRLHPLADASAAAFVDRLAAGWSALDAARREPLVAAHRAALAPGRRPAAARIVATTLSPADDASQRQAVASWLAAGFEPVAFNTADEIRTLRPLYPQLDFVATDTAPRLDELSQWFSTQGLPQGGWLHAGLELDTGGGPALAADIGEAAGGLAYLRQEGSLQALFWDTAALAKVASLQASPAIGAPLWGEHALLLPLAAGLPVRPAAIPLRSPAAAGAPAAAPAEALALFERIAQGAAWRPAQDRRLGDLLLYLLPRRATAAAAERQALDEALGRLLSLWFDDLLARNPDGAASATAPAPARGVAPATVPEISVVMPTFNRADILARCLQHLAQQTLGCERFEVIVVDDGSSDHTQAVLDAAPAGLRLTRLRQPNLGPAAARNRGLQAARGHWVLFLNDDALLVPEALQIHLDEHARRGPNDAVLGYFPMHPDFTPPTRPVGWCMEHTTLVFDYPNMQPGRPHGWQHFYTCNISLARELVLAVGGFDEGFVRMGAEDIEIGVRLDRQGCRVFFRPDCVGHHAHRLDAVGLARMFEFRGRGGVYLHACQTHLRPHYAPMPVSRIAEFAAQHQRLQPLLSGLQQALARADALPYVADGPSIDLRDDPTERLDFYNLWRWSEQRLVDFIEALTRHVERHTAEASRENAPSLQKAAAQLFPALLFVKWYYDTVGVVSSAQLPEYLRRAATELHWPA